MYCFIPSFFERFTNHHKLNNIIWVWTSYGTTRENWYPGDDVVDMIVYDYPDYSASNGSWKQFQTLFGTKGKLFGIGEDGRLTDLDVWQNQPWSYFLTWSYMVREPSSTNGKNTKDWLFKVYNDPRVFTLDDMTPGPKAYAGISRIVFDSDLDGKERVQLDGSYSKTNQGTITSYRWSIGNEQIAEGIRPEIELNLGTYIITLTITTSLGETATSQVSIQVKRVSAALQKTVRVSSNEQGSGNIGEMAVDGNGATRWSSAYADPQWIEIDLGKSETIESALLIWEDASARNYRVEISDNRTDWNVLRTVTNRPAGARVDSLNNLNSKGRYFRMYGTSRTTQWGYSLWEIEVFTDATVVSNENPLNAEKPIETKLFQNYPNPFNPSTVISYELSQASFVTISIHDLAGRTLSVLKRGKDAAGRHHVRFNSSGFSTGVYFYRLQTESITLQEKMVFIK